MNPHKRKKLLRLKEASEAAEREVTLKLAEVVPVVEVTPIVPEGVLDPTPEPIKAPGWAPEPLPSEAVVEPEKKKSEKLEKRPSLKDNSHKVKKEMVELPKKEPKE